MANDMDMDIDIDMDLTVPDEVYAVPETEMMTDERTVWAPPTSKHKTRREEADL